MVKNLRYKFENSSNNQIDTRSKLLIIGNECKMNAGVHLGFSYIFMHLWKLGLFFKILISLKPEFYQIYLKQNVSKLTY